MPRIFPFESLVFDPGVAGPLDRVTAPPYDVISEDRRRELLQTPYNIARLDLVGSEVGDGGDVYEGAGALFDAWIREGVLVRQAPAFHAYEMLASGPEGPLRVRGLLCGMELEDWGGGVIPHEATMRGPIDDRLRLLHATRTHLSPIYGTVVGPVPALADVLERSMAEPPDAEALDEQGVRHRRWSVPDDHSISRSLLEEPLLIADGHHRYTTALAYRNEMRASAGAGPWDGTLALVVDAGTEHPPVQPIHRIQLWGPEPQIPGKPVGLDAMLEGLSDHEPMVGVALAGSEGPRYHLVGLVGEAPAVRALHAEILDGLVPEGALQFTPDLAEAISSIVERRAVAAYLLPSTTADRIRSVIERGERLPPKSTYFWPKPRTGMVLMPLFS